MATDAERQAAIGARLRKLWEYQGFTQREIAEALGVSRPCATELAHGRRAVSATELLKLSRLLRVPVAYLLDEPADCTPEGAALGLALSDLGDDDRAELMRFAEYLRWRKGGDNG